MDKKKESIKIAAIIKSERFSYKGVEYALDTVATAVRLLKDQLEGRPLQKLVSTTGLSVWSHDAQAVDVIEEPTYAMSEPYPAYLPEIKKAPKKAPKKKKS